MSEISLSVQHLNKSFGGVAATQDVSMDFPRGSLTAIIGPNGAGKTTFFNLISGALKPDSGKVLLEGDDITQMSSAEIVTKGIGRAFQVAKLFKTLTVEESLRAALMSPAGKSANLTRRFPMPETRERADEIKKLKAAMPELSDSVIPKGTYKQLTEDHKTVGLYNFAIANKDVADDLVYAVVKAVLENNPQMIKGHAASKETLVQNWNRNGFLPFHPGAIRYFKEKGINVPKHLIPPEYKG